MSAQKNLPNQTQGNLAGAIVLSFPVVGWFLGPFVLIILLSRANTLSPRRGRDMLLLLAAAAFHFCGVLYILNLKGDDMGTGTLYTMAVQVAVLFWIFCTLSRNFKVWAWKGENSPWSG